MGDITLRAPRGLLKSIARTLALAMEFCKLAAGNRPVLQPLSGFVLQEAGVHYPITRPYPAIYLPAAHPVRYDRGFPITAIISKNVAYCLVVNL